MSDTTVKLDEQGLKTVTAQIRANLDNATDLLVSVIASKSYESGGFKTSAAYVKDLLAGSGWSFSTKRMGAERSARNKVIESMLLNGDTIPAISDALGVSVGTVHAEKKAAAITTDRDRGQGRKAGSDVVKVDNTDRKVIPGEASVISEVATPDVTPETAPETAEVKLTAADRRILSTLSALEKVDKDDLIVILGAVLDRAAQLGTNLGDLLAEVEKDNAAK